MWIPQLEIAALEPQTSPEDPEVKKATVLATRSMEHSSLLERIAYFSNWYRTKGAIAICQLFIERMKLRAKKLSDPPIRNDMDPPLEGIRSEQQERSSKCITMTVKDLQRAELLLIKEEGFWIMDGSSIVGHHISKCVTCRKLRAAPQQQKMADLPSDRLEQVIYLQCSGLLWTILHQRRAKGNEAIWSALYLHGFTCHPPGNGIFIDDRLILECISSICLSLRSCSAAKVEPGYQFCRREE